MITSKISKNNEHLRGNFRGFMSFINDSDSLETKTFNIIYNHNIITF